MTANESADGKFMARALELARLGSPSPNPHVGAVLVRDGEVIGEGYHARAGEEHAEIAAFKAALGDTQGATLYVTLEPCSHTGRTPPCTEAIANAGIVRVVVGCKDPNPHVSGGGAAKLELRGIPVTMGVLQKEAETLIGPWTKFIRMGMPYVTLKLALSLDGRIATRTGESKWVTGVEARKRVHVLRAAHDAVGVGIGTALADDPRLTVRDSPGSSPIRLVFDTHLRVPLQSRLVESAREVPTFVLAGPDGDDAAADALMARGVEVVRCPASAEGRIDMPSALRLLAGRGVVTLLIEGGAELAGSLLASELADELHAFIAPTLLGPRGRPGAVDWAGPEVPDCAPRIRRPKWELCGDDAYVRGLLAYPAK